MHMPLQCGRKRTAEKKRGIPIPSPRSASSPALRSFVPHGAPGSSPGVAVPSPSYGSKFVVLKLSFIAACCQEEMVASMKKSGRGGIRQSPSVLTWIQTLMNLRSWGESDCRDARVVVVVMMVGGCNRVNGFGPRAHGCAEFRTSKSTVCAGSSGNVHPAQIDTGP